MPPTSSAMELKVLISVLQQGNVLQNMVSQVNQLSQSLSALQAKANQGVGASPSISPALKEVPKHADEATKSLKGLEDGINRVVSAARFLAGGFLALQSVRFLKDLADTAAQAQVLQTVLHVVAQNAGITAEAIDAVDKQVQRLGITSASSRQSLTQLLQARLDLSFAPKLARAAQDLAVISGKNSSDTFSRLIVQIQQLDTMGLRFMGIIVDRELAEERYKQKIDATTRALNKREQQAALAEEVLRKAAELEGAYASAMGDVQKQIASLDRLTTTYKENLGNSLLPAYSAIVNRVGVMFEKLILLAQIFSSNTERAQALAEAADSLAAVFTNLAVFVMEHLETIILLVKWYLELKAVLLIFRGAEIYFLWLVKVIDWVQKIRLAFLAWEAGLVSIKVAMAAASAASVAEAEALLQLAAAQGAVATTAIPAAAGIDAVATSAALAKAELSGVALAWGTVLATLAIPAVGFIFYKIKTVWDKEEAKPFLVRAQEAFNSQVSGGPGEGPAWMKYFEQWKRDHPDVLKGLKDDGEALNVFRQQSEAAWAAWNRGASGSPVAALAKDLGEAVAQETALRTSFEQLQHREPRPAEMGELEVARKALADQSEKVSKLREAIRNLFKYEPQAQTTQDIFAQIDRIDELQRKLPKLKDDPATGRKALADAKARLEVEKESLKAAMAQQEEKLKADKTMNSEQKADELAATRLKAYYVGISDDAEAVSEATKQLFGAAKTFSEEGVGSGGFGKVFSAYSILLEQAKKTLDSSGNIPKKMAESLSEGLEELGKAASQPLDLKNLRDIVPQVQEIQKAAQKALGPGVEPLSKTLSAAIGRAQIQVRQEALQFRAPLVAERKEQIHRETDPAIEEAKQRLASLKDEGQRYSLLQEKRFDLELINLREYHESRQKVIIEEGTAELDLLTKQMAQQDLLTAAEQDPAAKAAARLRGLELEGQYTARLRQMNSDIFKDQNQEDTTRIKLKEQLAKSSVDFAAQVGGEQAALDALTYSINQEAEAYRKANIVGYEDYILKKQQAGIYDINRKNRERDYQLSLTELNLQTRRLDLVGQLRGVDRARDQAQVAQGEMSPYEQRVRENARIRADQEDNRTRRQIAVNELQRIQNRGRDEVQRAYNETLTNTAGQMDSVAQATKAQATEQEKQNALYAEAIGKIVQLDEAYQTMAGSVQLHSVELKKQFEEGFASALTQTIMDFHKAGEAWKSAMTSITTDIVNIFVTAFTQRLFKKLGLFNFVDSVMNRIFGGGGGGGPQQINPFPIIGSMKAEGGLISGPGTGTSDSIPAWVSTGEHIMPAAKTAQWLPVLEGIRTGRILPFAQGGVVQSIAMSPIIPRRYAAGGVVVADGGASAVQTGGGPGQMIVTMHPDTLNMTMRDWLEHEVVRQQGRR